MRLVFAPPPDSSSDAARVTTRERGRWAKHLALENVPVFGSAATARARALVDAADAEAAQRGAADARTVDVACMVLVGLHVPSRRVECGRHPRVARKISKSATRSRFCRANVDRGWEIDALSLHRQSQEK
jgi:hypothetical protein